MSGVGPARHCACGATFFGRGVECRLCRLDRQHATFERNKTAALDTYRACPGCGLSKPPAAFPPGVDGGRYPRCWACVGNGTAEDRARQAARRAERHAGATA